MKGRLVEFRASGDFRLRGRLLKVFCQQLETYLEPRLNLFAESRLNLTHSCQIKESFLSSSMSTSEMPCITIW